MNVLGMTSCKKKREKKHSREKKEPDESNSRKSEVMLRLRSGVCRFLSPLFFSHPTSRRHGQSFSSFAVNVRLREKFRSNYTRTHAFALDPPDSNTLLQVSPLYLGGVRNTVENILRIVRLRNRRRSLYASSFLSCIVELRRALNASPNSLAPIVLSPQSGCSLVFFFFFFVFYSRVTRISLVLSKRASTEFGNSARRFSSFRG